FVPALQRPDHRRPVRPAHEAGGPAPSLPRVGLPRPARPLRPRLRLLPRVHPGGGPAERRARPRHHRPGPARVLLLEARASVKGGPAMTDAALYRLDGKVAAVAGAGSGIGEAVALGAARLGARVCCFDLDETRARAV